MTTFSNNKKAKQKSSHFRIAPHYTCSFRILDWRETLTPHMNGVANEAIVYRPKCIRVAPVFHTLFKFVLQERPFDLERGGNGMTKRCGVDIEDNGQVAYYSFTQGLSVSFFFLVIYL